MRYSFTRLALSVAVGVALMGGAFSVHAASLTQDQISSIIGLLRSFGADAATITQVSQALGGQTTTPPSSVSCVDVTRTLTVDSQGSDVTNLQAYLIAKGYLAAGNATGFYGPLTAQAVGKLQLALGLITSTTDSAYGILGPKTRAAIACTPQGTSDTPAPTQNPTPTPTPTTTETPTQTVPNPSISSFTASPTTVVGGSAAALAWSASNVSSCTVSPISGDMRAVTYTGSASATTPAITQSTTYQLTCTALAGATGGAATRTVTVNYQAPVTPNPTPTPTPTPTPSPTQSSGPAPTISFFYSSPTTLDPGDLTVLTWLAKTTSGCTVKATTVAGSTFLDTASANVSPFSGITYLTVNNIQQATTFELRCAPIAGSNASSAVSTAKVMLF